MRRPTATSETLRLSPLIEASWADASGIERVPLVGACAEPLVLFAG
jgi:hypothetical protein